MIRFCSWSKYTAMKRSSEGVWSKQEVQIWKTIPFLNIYIYICCCLKINLVVAVFLEGQLVIISLGVTTWLFFSQISSEILKQKEFGHLLFLFWFTKIYFPIFLVSVKCHLRVRKMLPCYSSIYSSDGIILTNNGLCTVTSILEKCHYETKFPQYLGHLHIVETWCLANWTPFTH